MQMKYCMAILFLSPLLAPTVSNGQLGVFSPEQRIAFTAEWKGERFADGRPKVSDAVLTRLSDTTAEQAWDVLSDAGFRNQFEGGWQIVNPGKRMVGRAVTAVFMPRRSDVDSVIQAHGKAEGRIGDENSWIIDILQPGDVLVVDLFGKIVDGTIIGDNLGTAIYAKSRNGLVVDGAVRDVSGIQEIKGFQIYTRGTHPSALENVMLVGMPFAVKPFRTTTVGCPVRLVSVVLRSSTLLGFGGWWEVMGARYTSMSDMVRAMASISSVRTRVAWIYSTAGTNRLMR